ncbi:MAG: NAD(P)H-hydrate dehydratase [Gemmatimonadota bacterium]
MNCPKLVTGAQMSQIDRCAIEEFGVPGAELMERAGGCVVETIRDHCGGLEGLAVGVVCGKGNNGGDGYVVARLLHASGVPVRVLAVTPLDQASGDAAHHLGRLRAAGVEPEVLSPERGAAALAGCDLVVDAILGTGLRGGASGSAAAAIEQVNRAGRPVVAVDVPSGVEADSGLVHGPAVRAQFTVTFGLPKVGHLFYPGRSYCGSLHLVDIGLPARALEMCPCRDHLITVEAVAEVIPRRAPEAHKGSCGSALVLAGSVGLTGAAALTAEAALVSGAGRVTLGVPESLNDILEVKLTEVMTRPLPEVRRPRCLSLRSLGEVRRLLREADSLALGPGLGRHRETGELVRRLTAEVELPCVIDADGLHALAGWPGLAGGAHPNLVLTPHAGEFARLSGLEVETILAARVERARQFAQGAGLTLLLKGAPTVVAAADGRIFVNPTGNAGMATAGSGDVLTGLVAGLLAQGLEPLEAACAGAYIHGSAGDRARERLGEWGMKAGDIGAEIPAAMRAAVSPGAA